MDESIKPLQPHQQRVVAERDDLSERQSKLVLFLDSPAFQALDHAEQRRLQRQEWIMQQYQEVLTERIASF